LSESSPPGSSAELPSELAPPPKNCFAMSSSCASGTILPSTMMFNPARLRPLAPPRSAMSRSMMLAYCVFANSSVCVRAAEKSSGIISSIASTWFAVVLLMRRPLHLFSRSD
jgi:hypothetical protein